MNDPSATTSTTSPEPDPLDRILSRGCAFDFFQAVWLLERLSEGRVSVGQRGPVAHEGFRFRPDLSIAFPASDVRRIERRTDRSGDAPYYLVEVTFMGLYGVSTPLPLHYAVEVLRSVDAPTALSDVIAEREVAAGAGRAAPPARATPLRDFLDIFHHRLISLFYRSWLKYRYDRAFGAPNRDAITDYLLWLIGCPRSYDRATIGLPPLELLRYAGVLTQHPRSAATLEGVLFDYWQGLPVSVQQCSGRWVAIAPADQNRIGAANSRLGEDLTIGEEVYDLSGSFNITLGPMDWSTYLMFLPGEACSAETCCLVRLYCSDPLSFTLELSLKAAEAPPTRLSSQGTAGRLGYTTWLRTADLPATSVTFGTSAGNRPPSGREQGGSAPRRESSVAPVAARAAAW